MIQTFLSQVASVVNGGSECHAELERFSLELDLIKGCKTETSSRLGGQGGELIQGILLFVFCGCRNTIHGDDDVIFEFPGCLGRRIEHRDVGSVARHDKRIYVVETEEGLQFSTCEFVKPVGVNDRF